ncbi:hypothetical protein F4054_17420 [Candidatus Poribacteria bacterium]|nr:hypothetical protein [Candidatus Poribacteria bacterium]MYG06748.1 hypothetical protein [Candidatus Poribacteria bacterium]MYK24025.1 hypothetical protein [Candidatus Poribacteria bacterium]
MKTTFCFTLTLLTWTMLVFVPNSFAQDGSPEYVVRVIYFLPNDREPQPDIDAKLDTLMKDAQQFYADQMEAHGFDRKIFRFEADENGNAVVHYVNGEFNDAYYQNPSTGSWIVWKEIEEQFDTSKNIYFLALDISSNFLDGSDNIFGRGSGNSLSGTVLVPASELGAAIHELGHAFGLLHDYRFKAKRIFTSSLQDWMTTSFCAAEWLDAHRYFNANQEDFNENTDVQLHPPVLAEPPYNIRLRFTVTDPDGLHQAQLFFPQRTNESTLAACQSLSGNNATVEFLTDELIGVNGITLRVMDRHGNFTEHFFPIEINNLLQDRDVVISIPDPNLVSEVQRNLGMSPGVAITRLDMLKLKAADFTNGGQITDLTGLEYAINLQVLELSDQGIQDITPLAKLSKLDTLWLDGNPINNITALAGLTNLLNLGLGRTQINDLTPLAELTSLSSLTISQNKIDDITPLAGLTNLWNLHASVTQIKDIAPLAGLTNLHQLTLDGNQPEIKDIAPLAGLTNLVYLVLFDNKIDDITPLMDMTNLRWLNLGFNQVNDITPLAGLNLESLNFRGNQVNDITPLAGLTNLRRLIISENPISDISLITRFTQLRTLSLGGIPIKDTTFLTELTELETLVLPNCQISEISQIARLTQLQWLSLDDNQISNVRPLINLLSLKHLSLVRNPIRNREPLFMLLRKNPGIKIYLKRIGAEPLPVTLSYFSAAYADTGIVLKWITESEVDNAGFYIYRSETKAGEFKVVNPTMIQGAGTTSERNTYTWTDTTAKPNTVYYYQIEDVSHAGVRKSLATVRMRGLVSASGKLTTIWADLKMQD